jgi:hypothetical protein
MMYKIQGGLAHNYLMDACPPLTRDRTCYDLRSGMDVSTPPTRTTTYQKSFLPQTIKDWNSLDRTVRDLKTIENFKDYQSKNCGYKLNTLYHYGANKSAINQTRMRLGLSGLSFQRFSYNHIDNPKCLNCNAPKEDPTHYFLLCPVYAEQREELLLNVTDLLHINNIEIDFPNPKFQIALVNLLLQGNSILNATDNEKIFHFVQDFIKNTGRFP